MTDVNLKTLLLVLIGLTVGEIALTLLPWITYGEFISRSGTDVNSIRSGINDGYIVIVLATYSLIAALSLREKQRVVPIAVVIISGLGIVFVSAAATMDHNIVIPTVFGGVTQLEGEVARAPYLEIAVGASQVFIGSWLAVDKIRRAQDATPIPEIVVDGDGSTALR